MTIGVLDIQGSVEEHIAMLKRLGVEPIAVKTKKDLEAVDGLIIPGGESTTIGKLMKAYGLDKEIRKRAISYPPLVLWGSCAGAILLASARLRSLRLINIEVERNAYGRQIDSFETKIKIAGMNGKKMHAVFIRAPIVKKAGRSVKILAQYDGKPVMLRQGHLLATMFHPELTNDSRIHQYFISMVKEYADKKSKN